jgi:predicted ATPase
LPLNQGLTAALENWVEYILSWEPPKLKNWKERLRNSLDITEISILIYHWPQLKPLFPVDDATQNRKGYQYEGTLLLRMLEASSLSPDYPLVVWIDNCQWMEEPSFQWVMSATHYFAKTSAKHILFVLTYTTTKREDSRYFWNKDLQDLKSKSCIQIKEITLENLDCQTVTNWLEYIFGSNSGPMNHVISHIYPVTKGNPHYTKELLHYLLENSLATKTFKDGNEDPYVSLCNTNEIRDFETTYFSKKMQMLLEEAMEVIQIAACMGYCVNSKLVASVLSYNVQQHLEVATKVGILICHLQSNRMTSMDKQKKAFQFIHNGMHQAAINSIQTSKVKDIPRMHVRIACKLIQNLNDIDLKAILLTVVGHTIQGADYVQVQERQSFATYALEAAQLAVKKMSFEAAQLCPSNS